MDDKTTLYRLYDHQDRLLYIGIARSWPSRMTQHAADKTWWKDVHRVAVEEHSSRPAALEAERSAIGSEAPLHNVVHNSKTAKPLVTQASEAPVPSYGTPLRRGQVVALGLDGGDCPVGLVEGADEEWVSITLISWIIGMFDGNTIAVRIADVRRMLWADWGTQRNGRPEFDVEPLGRFQTAWKEQHASNRQFAEKPWSEQPAHNSDTGQPTEQPTAT